MKTPLDEASTMRAGGKDGKRPFDERGVSGPLPPPPLTPGETRGSTSLRDTRRDARGIPNRRPYRDHEENESVMELRSYEQMRVAAVL